MIKKIFSSGFLAGLALILGLAFAGGGISYAASNHGVSGTVYSGCSGYGPWYYSNNAHYKVGTGSIKLQFSAINDGGISWKLIDSHNAQFGYQQTWTSREIGTQYTLANNVSDGKLFYNAFRDYNYSCPDSQTSYNFYGSEYF